LLKNAIITYTKYVLGGPNAAGLQQARDKAQDIETKALQVWTPGLDLHLAACLPHSIFACCRGHGIYSVALYP